MLAAATDECTCYLRTRFMIAMSLAAFANVNFALGTKQHEGEEWRQLAAACTKTCFSTSQSMKLGKKPG
jgi:hypothetical protein